MKYYNNSRCVAGLSAVAIFAAVLLAPLAVLHAATPAKPNIVVILADDLGYGDLSCYGSTTQRTPHLDKLAVEGLRLTDFHVTACVCTPTRAAFLTGRYQQRCGMNEVLVGDNAPAAGLTAGVSTLPQVLKTAGYRTALIGKWHLGNAPENHPLHCGFDEFHGFLDGALDYISHVRRDGRLDWWDGLTLKNEPGYTTHLMTRHAVDFIKANRQQPFFLEIAEQNVHGPYQGPNDPPEFPERQKNTMSPQQKKVTWQNMHRAYNEMLTELDRSVGAVLAALRETGLDQRTLVVFFSDNGALPVGSNKPLRGFKHHLYEGGQREPAIIWWPGKIQPGVNNDFISSLDLMPTFYQLAGTQAPVGRKLDGADISATLFTGVPPPRRPFFWAYHDGFAMREGPWKLMKDEGKTMPVQLFNLQQDPGEKHDLAAQYPQRVITMQSAWEQWLREVTADAPPHPAGIKPLSPERQRELKQVP